MGQKIIKYVALYLRKSRGDAETDLEKHRLILTELCKINNWKYVVYEEIMSGDSIEMRPKFQKLLADVESEVYDAVCVVDIDRLGRGDEEDQGKIKKAFAKSDTYVITPEKVYNLNNAEDKFVVDMKTFISRQEYSQITKRLGQGKKVGARQGMWTNGTPPYPYEYRRWGDKYDQKGLVVNDEKLIVYRHIINAVIKENKTPSEIACELNREGITSPRNGTWNGVTIYRLLLDETHLGKIIANKTKGDGHKKKKSDAPKAQRIPKDQWVVVENCHEAVKTQEEHEKILLFLSRLTATPKRKPIRILPLTGLVKCGLCGHTMTLYYRDDRPKNPESLKPCWYHNPLGDKCPNQGMITNVIYNHINKKILSYKQELQQKMEDTNFNDKRAGIESKISVQNNLLASKQLALTRILDAFENGAYSLNQFKERKAKIEKAIAEIQEQISLLQLEAKHYDSTSIDDKLSILDKFEADIKSDNLSDLQKNKLYKSIIDSIIWTRLGKNIDIKINFK